MHFTETEILDKLDLAFRNIPPDDYPEGSPGDIKYQFFLDLEHGYCIAAGSKIHLYGDETRWAIVLEKCGYQNRGDRAEIELVYIGNCIDYPVNKYPERNYISNIQNIQLISADEFERIRNKEAEDSESLEDFELISPLEKELTIHGQKVAIVHDVAEYTSLGIQLRDYDNPKNLIGFGDIVRYFSDTNPGLVSATEQEIKQHIPQDITKLMTIDNFHVGNSYTEQLLPSNQETYQLIAKVLATGNTLYWQPTLEPNNHWKNWESGFL